MKKSILYIILCALIFGVNAQISLPNYWELNGNSGTSSLNFLGTTDCEPLIFKTKSIERMRLAINNTLFGIGTSTPKATLHLHHQIDQTQCKPIPDPTDLVVKTLLQLTTPETGSNANNGFNISFDTKDIIFKQQEQAKFTIEGPGGGMMIAPNGNIGMGTDIPRQKLHVADGNIIITKPINSASVFNGSLIFGNNGSNPVPPYIWGISYLNSVTDGKGLNFWKYVDVIPSSAPTCYPVLFFSDNLNVGIGTSDPQAKLDVDGGLKAVSANISGTLTTNKASIMGSAYISGNLGVGILDPQAKLDVNGAFKALS
ncbi:MAG: hypothetical protein LBU83_12440, partial [Bacteroidales bacterium]|nr:hypothetical protein [Bacteroidales bacterium]